MGGQKNQKTEAEALNSMEHGETKLQKKHKNKQKRKLEETDAEERNKKEEQEETPNGSAETLTKKKKKEKVEGKEEITSNGSVKESKKKKKKDKEEAKETASDKEEKNGREGGEDAVEDVREGTGVLVSGKNVNDSKYKPLDSFNESGLPSNVLECCKSFDKPSPIQSHSWPYLLDGRDFIGIAATGSGKLCFVYSFLL